MSRTLSLVDMAGRRPAPPPRAGIRPKLLIVDDEPMVSLYVPVELEMTSNVVKL